MTEPRPSAPPAVRWITRTLEDAGYATWAVGGAVRDVLLDLPSGDWDLATRARPPEVRRIFRRTVPLGVEHGTVGVLSDDGTMFEVTTFRRDVETDGRHAVVEFADRLEDDLARRDFTVNAIAWHPLREEFLDPFGGRTDLEAGVLRAVGEAAHRFAEDYLRILRALRFAGRFSLEIEAGTWAALEAAVGHLPELSSERIREELLKVLDADAAPSVALGLYRSSGTLAVLYPELEALSSETWSETLASLDLLPPGRPLLRLAALLRALEPRKVARVLLRLKLSNAQTDETAHRAQAPPLPDAGTPDAGVRRWLSRVGPGRLAAVARLELAKARAAGSDDRAAEVVDSWRRARRILAGKPPLTVGDLALDGSDLIGLGLKPGPRFGEILDGLLDWVLDDPERNRNHLLADRVRALVDGGEDVG